MNIINTLITKIKNLDQKLKKIMCVGFIISFNLCILATILLFTYEYFYKFPPLFYSGISLLRSSLIFACSFFIGGIGFDTIKNEIDF